MKLLPTEAAARRRLLLMTVTVVVLGGLYYQFGGGPTYVIPQTTGPAPTSKPTVRERVTTRTGKQAVGGPQKLHLREMEQVPEEPEAGRDPFRFGVRPTPKPTATPTPVYTPQPVVTPPPPPPPKVPLLLTVTILDSNNKLRAYLHDKNGTTFEGVEGDTIDGRYKLLRVGNDSVVMIFVDGTGQTTIYRGG